MQQGICRSCRTALRIRLREQVTHLQIRRRAKSAGRGSQPLQSWYWDTQPPNPRQLAASKWFFEAHKPHNIWTAGEWKQNKHNDKDSDVLTPEVAFLGRSNAGKSSLLNALLNVPTLNKVGNTPGKTKVLRAYGLFTDSGEKGKKAPDFTSKNLVTVLDAPGYGQGSQESWGKDIMKYMKERKHLKRIFLLVPAHHGLKPADFQLLKLLRAEAIPHQIISTKCDRFESPTKRAAGIGQTMEKLVNDIQPPGAPNATFALGEIMATGWLGDGTSNLKVKPNEMQGVSAVQWAVLRATGLDQYALSSFSERVVDAVKYDNTPLGPNVIRKPQVVDAPAINMLASQQASTPANEPSLAAPVDSRDIELQPHKPATEPTPEAPEKQHVFRGIESLMAATATKTPSPRRAAIKVAQPIKPAGHGTSRSSIKRRGQAKKRDEMKGKLQDTLETIASKMTRTEHASMKTTRDRLPAKDVRDIARSLRKNPFSG